MIYVRIIDLRSSPNSDQVSATLSLVTIDETGSVTTNPDEVAHELINITSLVALNQQVVEKFKQSTCQGQYYGGIQVPNQMVCQVANPVDGLKLDIEQLQKVLEDTLKQASWLRIREELLHSLIHTNPRELFRLVIRTDDVQLQSLPIERTSFITEQLMRNNRPVSVVFAPRTTAYQQLVWDGLPKVLLVLGSQKGIKEPISHSEIEGYLPSSAIITPLANPFPDDLLKTIADSIYDVIIIIGHSHTNDNGFDGRIKINDGIDRNSVSIGELTQPFRSSVNNGLKLVILAGCSSIGVARALASKQIGVPNIIAFRVPVHYLVLRSFFDRFLTKWTKQFQSLEIALTETRAELSVHDRDCPGASSILPILLTLPYEIPLEYPKEIPVESPIANPPVNNHSHLQKISHILTSSAQVPIKFRGKEMKIPGIVFIGLGLAIAGYIVHGCTSLPKLEATCNLRIGDGISCGEEILLKEGSVSSQADKQAGANAIADEDYPKAVQLLTRAWSIKKDPETLIMLENAKLVGQNLPIKTIAATIPGSQSTPLDIPTGMLKAVAFAQQQHNADSNHTWKVQVVIVDDRNDKDHATRSNDGSSLVDNLLKRGILAGIGSYSSVVSLPVKEIYKKHQTVLVSSTSTSTELSNPSPDTFFYRACSDNRTSGKQIANYLRANKYTKIALFYTSGKTFSESMTRALKSNLQEISIVKESNFEGRGSASDAIKEAKQAGAQAIVLIPDAYTDETPERTRLISIIRANNGGLPIIGNEVVKDQTLFSFSRQELQKLVISLPWHSSSYQNNTIAVPAFWGNKAQLDHRIAMTYDATQVVIKALDILPMNQNTIDGRKQIQKILSDPTFRINGITGEISFTGSDRSQPINSLVQPKCDATKCSGFQPAS
jgi:ABC-type branched-subunit amino acid transport system substrate-binding protein